MKRLLLALALLFLAGAAAAHKASDSYLTLTRAPADSAAFDLRWDIALRDLDNAITLDANGDGEITWGEVRAKHDAIVAYALSRLAISADGLPCRLTLTRQLIDEHSDGHYDVLMLTGTCPVATPTLTIDYRLLFDIDPTHRGLLQFVDGTAVRSVIFSADDSQQRVGGGEGGWLTQFTQYLRDGTWHIWLGFDHILFLLSLLLPSVLIRRGQSWQPAETFRDALADVVKVVTAFTIAHSITLSLATLGIVTPNARFVDSGIALSVVFAAINNLIPRVEHGRWLAAFGFGLIHGFGFASALRDLGLPAGALALSLFGFNLGVELGQLAIVVVFLPLAFALRATWAYRRVILTGGSTAIAAIASVWLFERAFNVALPTLTVALAR